MMRRRTQRTSKTTTWLKPPSPLSSRTNLVGPRITPTVTVTLQRALRKVTYFFSWYARLSGNGSRMMSACRDLGLRRERMKEETLSKGESEWKKTESRGLGLVKSGQLPPSWKYHISQPPSDRRRVYYVGSAYAGQLV